MTKTVCLTVVVEY